jgi:regulator of sigma E protease
MFEVILIFFSLIFLIILHELGHFFFAKIFKVKVEEFGIFLPPPLFKKKIGETVYSLNLIPFGAFVKIFGETERKKEQGSFSNLPLSKRALVIIGGCLSFWILAMIFYFIVLQMGVPVAVEDEKEILNPSVKIIQVQKNSPAFYVNLKSGDEILEINNEKIEKASQVQKIVREKAGEIIRIKIKRGKEIFEVSVVPRKNFPEGEGPLGISMIKVGIEKYSFLSALLKTPSLTFENSWAIVKGYFEFAKKIFHREKIPETTLMGPIGITQLMWQISQMGFNHYLNFLALLCLYLAIFNLLPIPALDGGKLLFLGIEAIRKKPVDEKTEEAITGFFFVLLILIAIFVTVGDIKRIFLK